MPQPTGRNGAVQARLQVTCHSRFNVDNLYRLQPLGEPAIYIYIIYNFWLHTKSVDITYLPYLSCAAVCSCIAALTLIEHYWRWVSGFPTFTCGQVSGWCCTTSCQQLSQSAHLSCGSLLAWPCTGGSHCHGPWSLDTKRVSEWLWRSLEFATRTKIPSFFFPVGKPRSSECLDAEFAFMMKAVRNWCQGSYFLQCEDGSMIAKHNSSCRATCTSAGSLWVDEGRVEARCSVRVRFSQDFKVVS